MTELILPFDWHRVVIAPWTENPSISFWTVLMGFLVTATCGLVGNYLILRRMALVGDAISHSILPGIAIAFLAAGALGKAGLDWTAATGAATATATAAAAQHHDYRNPVLMFAGALVAGILTTILIEVIHKKSRVKQDAAIGITFSSLFAFGVILISLFASKVDLDQECVLYGEITHVSQMAHVELAGLSLGPPAVVRMAAVMLITVIFIVVFYKELLVSSFDSGLAASLGINASVVHYALMSWLSVIVVSAFEAVGAILVIAMLILPGATVSLLSERFPVILSLSVLVAAISSLLGWHLAVWLDCSTAAAMVVVACGLFVIAWMFSLRRFIARMWRKDAVSSSDTDCPEITPPVS